MIYSKNKQSGFGLVEVIVSLTIMTIVMLGFNYLSRTAFYSWENAQNKAIAYNLIQDMIEEIHNKRDYNVNFSGRTWFQDLDSLNGKVEKVPDFPDFTRKITIANVPATVNYNGGNINLSDSKKKITIEITWKERLGDRSLSGSTYLTDWRGKY